MRKIRIIFVFCIMSPCLAGDFDNPYIGYYTAAARMNSDFDAPYIKYYNVMSELEINHTNAHSREQSTANKLLGAAAIGLTGFGGMNLMAGLAEQSADADAEQDMRAYLATFVCDYGAGRNITGGTMNIQVAAGNDMALLVAEYKKLAMDLKVRKDALGKQPGIESQVIFDAADTGLYDNMSTGRQSGAYTSLSRALSDENSADAVARAEQKSDAQSKTKTGAIVGGVGAIGGAAGNLLINGTQKQPDSRSGRESDK